MKKLLLILSLCSSLPFSAWGQNQAEESDVTIRPVTSSLTAGVGVGKMRDTYLTPLLYQGVSLDIHFDRSRMMRQCRWGNQQTIDLSYMLGNDQAAGLTSSRVGRLRYRYAMHKVWRLGAAAPEAPFVLYVGPYAGMDLGFNYNLKMAAGNNPATARFTSNLGVSAGGEWHYSIRRQPCSLQLDVKTPLLGMALAPDYGASYYETYYLKTSDSYLKATMPTNQQDFDFRLTTDIPVSVLPFLKKLDTTVRLGFAYHIETMDINHIVTRNSTCEFVLGWSYQYLPFSRRKAKLYKLNPAYAY